MTQQDTSRAGRVAIVCAVIALVLAISAALIRYLRFGQIDVATIAGGIVIPGIIILLVKSTSVKKQ
jgi:hypothetical protein